MPPTKGARSTVMLKTNAGQRAHERRLDLVTDSGSASPRAMRASTERAMPPTKGARSTVMLKSAMWRTSA